MTEIVKALKQVIMGEVKEDPMTKHIYSVDASIFEIAPDLVILPKRIEDVLETVKIANAFQMPLIPRGGATGIAGGCLGKGIVIDTSKYLNRILDFNPEEKWILTEPGVTQDELNAYVAPYGLRLGPETSTSNRATIGGMCATNAAGAHFLKYGNMSDHVIEVEMVLSSGERTWLGPNHPFFPVEEIRKEIANKTLQERHRSSSGYLLSPFHETPFNPAKITVGSEGTFGIFSKVKLNLSSKLSHTFLVLFPFSSLETALENVPSLLEYKPISLELLDNHLLSFAKISPKLKHTLDWLEGDPEALLIAEFENEVPASYSHKKILSDDTQKKNFWMVRKGGLGLLLSRRSYARAIAFIEDLSLPPLQLAPFMKKLKTLLGREMGVYGHAGEGCLHIRPFVDLRSEKEREWIFKMMGQVAILVKEHQGVLSGEHGDGILRSWLNKEFFGEEIYHIFQRMKEAFDPLNLMNPGKIIGAKKPLESVRKNSVAPYPTYLNFEKEGGFTLSVDLCNGNGECRKKTGLMCPSFHAFGDEKHTTRARAQSLRAVLQETSSLNKEVLDVLDYCLECKGCKTECPSNVDMAKMKMEMLFQYQEKHGYFFLNRLFGNLPTLSLVGSSFAPLSNWITQFPITKFLFSLSGIAKERAFPPFAKKRFSLWFKKHSRRKSSKKIALFNDTFTEFYAPEVGIAAVELLEKTGYEVSLLPYTCCGRTYLSKGLLKKAKSQALLLEKVFQEAKAPVVVLEPSCLSAFKEDYQGLIDTTLKVFPIEAFLPKLEKNAPFFFHPHCHEQALGEEVNLTSLVAKETVIRSKGGCCGLAGSFGYEKKHYEMSLKIGEKHLFPHVQELNLDTFIVASGFSCRSQIEHGTHRKALHPVEFYNQMLRSH